MQRQAQLPACCLDPRGGQGFDHYRLAGLAERQQHAEQPLLRATAQQHLAGAQLQATACQPAGALQAAEQQLLGAEVVFQYVVGVLVQDLAQGLCEVLAVLVHHRHVGRQVDAAAVSYTHLTLPTTPYV